MCHATILSYFGGCFKTLPIKNNKFRMDYLSVRSALSQGVKEGAIAAIIKQNPAVRPPFLQTVMGKTSV